MDHRPKCKTVKLLEENIGENLDDFEYGDAFLDKTPKAWGKKEIIDKPEFIEIKNICSVKDKIKRIRKQFLP